MVGVDALAGPLIRHLLFVICHSLTKLKPDGQSDHPR
jgi:hypothetical protein